MIDNKVLEVSPSVKWIGVLDPDIRTFDIVMETKYGTTYNSYLINADKKAIVETVKEKFVDIFERKLRMQIDPVEIEYIIVNHTEPDHSGSIKRMLEMSPNATVVGSGNAIRYLTDLLNFEFKYQVVKDGDVLNLGNMNLKFVGAPNLHWPDSMFTYLQEENILFTCDLFGAHYCHQNMYDDRVGNFDESFRYYFDVILCPFSRFIIKAVEKIEKLEIKAICTGHGPILTSNWKRYVDLIEGYAREYMLNPVKNTIFVGYVSAYHKTQELAEKIAEGMLMVEGIKVELHDIEKMPLAEIDSLIAKSTAIVLGSPTINQNTLLQLYQTFAMINPIRDRTKLFSSFGSYGWSGEAEKIITSALSQLKLKYFGRNLFVKFTPKPQDYASYVEFGKEFAEQLLSNSCSD
ncbi:MAG: FprA family A-type flavoprotein [Bacteroidota bacterium]